MQIWPYDADAVVVEFHAVGGMAVVQFETQELRAFLTRSYELVAKGDEARHLDVEADLAALLREA